MNDPVKAPTTLLPTLMKRIQQAENVATPAPTERQHMLHSTRWQDRVNTLHALDQNDHSDILLMALNDSDESVRVAALQIQMQRKTPLPISRIVTILQQDPSSLVREAAAIALAEQPQQAVQPYLNNAQYDPDANVRATVQTILTEYEQASIKTEETHMQETTADTSVTDKKEQPEADLPPVLAIGQLRNPSSRQKQKRRGIVHLAGFLAAAMLLISLVSIGLVMQPLHTASPQPATLTDRLAWQRTYPNLLYDYWSDDSQSYLAASTNELQIFNTRTKQVAVTPHTLPSDENQPAGGVTMGEQSPHNRYTTTHTDNPTNHTQTLAVWNTLTQTKLLQYTYKDKLQLPDNQHSARPVWWSHDDQSLAIFDHGNVLTWDLTGTQTQREIPVDGNAISSLAWSQDKQAIAFIDSNHMLTIWDVAGNTRISFIFLTGGTHSLSFSPNMQWLAVTSAIGTNIIDVKSGRIITVVAGNTLTREPEWSHDSRYLLTISNTRPDRYTQHVWHIPDGKIIFQAFIAHEKASTLSPDGRYLALETPERKVQLWEVKSGHLLTTYNDILPKGIIPAQQLFWSPDSTYIAAQLQDKTVSIWHINQNVQATKTAKLGDIVDHIQWSPDMKHLAIRSSMITNTTIKPEQGSVSYSTLNTTISIWRWL